MFTPKDRINLINELNIQLESNTFYDNSMDDIIYSNKKYVPDSFNGVGLFRPLVNNDFNPLNEKVYNYSAAPISIKGMAFQKDNGEIVENPLAKPYKIVDNAYEFRRNANSNTTEKVNTNTYTYTYAKANTNAKSILNSIASTNNIFDKNININAVKGTVSNVKNNVNVEYKMSDIIKNTSEEQILSYREIPRELALAKTSKWRSILFKEIDVMGTIKNIFSIK